MSVRFVAVRLIHAFQTEIDSRDELEGLGDEWFFFDGKSFHTSRQFAYIEMVSVGWEKGTRCRVKRTSITRALEYVNKLHSGHWIDDDTYHSAYTAVDELIRRHQNL